LALASIAVGVLVDCTIAQRPAGASGLRQVGERKRRDCEDEGEEEQRDVEQIDAAALLVGRGRV
jgi:hypothetical protein